MEHATILLVLAIAFGFFMAWGIGANDVANAMGTSVGSRAINLKQAVIIAAIFESAGALLAGGNVTDTIRGGIIDSHALIATPEILVFGMLAALLAAGTWLLIASYFGWPVSTTHSIVGALIGFGAVELGIGAVHWHKVVTISLSWIVSPIISGILAYLVFMSLQFLILRADKPFIKAKRYMPMYAFLVALVISMVTLREGLVHLGFNFSFGESLLIASGISLVVAAIGMMLVNRIKFNPDAQRRFHFHNVEKIFGILMVFTACAMAFAHGSNDVANAIGPLSAVIEVIRTGIVGDQSPISIWVMGLGALGIVAGLSMYGYKVIETVGRSITELTPSRGFAAQFATASTVVIASGTGLPISTTQTLVGAVLGVGIARGIGALNLGVIANIFVSWVITLPAGAILAIVFFHIINFIFK